MKRAKRWVLVLASLYTVLIGIWFFLADIGIVREPSQHDIHFALSMGCLSAGIHWLRYSREDGQ